MVLFFTTELGCSSKKILNNIQGGKVIKAVVCFLNNLGFFVGILLFNGRKVIFGNIYIYS